MKNLPLIVFAGLITGALAAIVQLFFNVYPPYAYGLCVACHARDLINWLVNAGTGLNLSVAGVSVVVPVLTVIGIVLGAFIGSKQTREFRFKTTKNPLTMFILGFLVMISALILGACPLRTILRIAYGDIIAIIGFVCIVVGVLVSVQLLKWNTKRNTKDLEAL